MHKSRGDRHGKNVSKSIQVLQLPEKRREGYMSNSDVPKVLKVQDGCLTRRVKGVRITVPAAYAASQYVEFLYKLANTYPLTKGARVALILTQDNALPDTGVFSAYCQGLAAREQENAFRITVPIGTADSAAKRLNWALSCLAHEYKHCLQWSVEGYEVREGGAVRPMESAAWRFGAIESRRFLGLPEDPYGDFAAFDAARALRATPAKE